jgi:methyltransferase-like protein
MTLVYRKKDDLLTRRIAGETIVVPIRGKLADMQNIFAVNAVAEFIWERMDGQRTLDQIAREVAEHFEVGEGQARSDVLEFAGELNEAGLIEKM